MSQRSTRHILVTGGAGYMGSTLVPMLLKAGHHVHVIDTLYFGEESLKSFEGNEQFELTREDILHQENLPDLFDGIDTVIHLASISNDPTCDLDPNLSIRTNFLATMALARRAAAEGVHQFIFASSCSVYGASGDRLLDESSRTGPVTLYALTKLESERELMKLSSREFAVTVLRFATLFGYSPRMRFDLAVNVMTKNSVQGKGIFVNGDGRQYRPFVHVHDASRAIMLAMNADHGRVAGQVFNVGSSKLNYTIADLAAEIASAFNDMQVERIEANADVRSYRVKFAKIFDSLGFVPERAILDGVAEIVARAKSGELGDMDDDRYYNLLVMRDGESAQSVPFSLASEPRWAT